MEDSEVVITRERQIQNCEYSCFKTKPNTEGKM